MSKTSIIINSTDTAGKSAQKTFTDVNPDATNDQLATLGQMLAAVSSNTYQGTTRIDKTDCDTETKTNPYYRIQTFIWDETQSKAVNTTYSSSSLPNPLVVDTRALQSVDGVTTFQFFILPPAGQAAQSLITRARMPRLINVTTTGSTNVELKAQSYDLRYNSAVTHYTVGNESATINATLHVDEDDNFYAFNLPITIQIVQGGE